MPKPVRKTIILRLSLATASGLLAAAAALAPLLSIDVRHELRFARFLPGCGWGVLGAVPPLLLFAALRKWPSAPVRRIDDILRKLLLPLCDDLPWYGLLWVALLAGISEEVFFRGVAQQAIRIYTADWLAILIAGLAFGLAHYVTLTYAFLATAIGCYFGWLLVASDGLWSPIVAHAVYDFVVLEYLMWERRRNVESPTPEDGTEPCTQEH